MRRWSINQAVVDALRFALVFVPLAFSSYAAETPSSVPIKPFEQETAFDAGKDDPGKDDTEDEKGKDEKDDGNDAGMDEEENDESSKIKHGGYISAGALLNTNGGHWNGNTGTGSHNGGSFYGLYYNVAKEAETGKCDGDFGYGVDMIFGEDSRFCRALDGFDHDWYTGHSGTGNPWYGFAMPQLYAEYALGSWSVRGGRFYGTLGYESIKSNERFFPRFGIADDILPTAYGGGSLSYHGWEKTKITVGWTNGLDQGLGNRNGGSLLFGMFTRRLTERLDFTYSFVAGDFLDHQDSDGDSVQTSGSIHFWGLSAKITPKLEVVSTSDLHVYRGFIEEKAYDFSQYIFQTINDHWRAGARVEWQRFVWEGAPADERTSVTLGAQWSPTGEREKLVIRPTVRYDRNTARVYGPHENKIDQLCFGFDVTKSF